MTQEEQMREALLEILISTEKNGLVIEVLEVFIGCLMTGSDIEESLTTAKREWDIL